MTCDGGTHSTAIVILAAGLSNRFTGDKMVAELRGKPLLMYPVESALKSGAAQVVVVLNDRQDSLAHLMPRGVRIAINTRATDGLSSSISVGIREVKENACSCILLLGDQPLVTASMLDTLMQRHQVDPDAIVAFRYNDEPRNPALFPRTMFARLSTLKGDKGARELINAQGTGSRFIDIDDETDLMDVDKDEELSWIEDRLSARREE